MNTNWAAESIIYLVLVRVSFVLDLVLMMAPVDCADVSNNRFSSTLQLGPTSALGAERTGPSFSLFARAEPARGGRDEKERSATTSSDCNDNFPDRDCAPPPPLCSLQQTCRRGQLEEITLVLSARPNFAPLVAGPFRARLLGRSATNSTGAIIIRAAKRCRRSARIAPSFSPSRSDFNLQPRFESRRAPGS